MRSHSLLHPLIDPFATGFLSVRVRPVSSGWTFFFLDHCSPAGRVASTHQTALFLRALFQGVDLDSSGSGGGRRIAGNATAQRTTSDRHRHSRRSGRSDQSQSQRARSARTIVAAATADTTHAGTTRRRRDARIRTLAQMLRNKTKTQCGQTDADRQHRQTQHSRPPEQSRADH